MVAYQATGVHPFIAGYYTQPIIDHYYEIAPGDIPDPTFKNADGSVKICERAPLYNTAAITNPSGAIWVSQAIGTSSGPGTQAAPYATVAQGLAAIAAGAGNKWLVVDTGIYRESWGSAGVTKCLGVTGAKNSRVWFDGSKILPSAVSDWTLAGGVWTYTGTYNPQWTQTSGLPPNDQIYINGVPLIPAWSRSTGTWAPNPGPGQFKVAGTTLKVGTNPVGQVVEANDLQGVGGGFTAKNGFTIQYVGFRRWNQKISFTGDNQNMNHVVIAYQSGEFRNAGGSTIETGNCIDTGGSSGFTGDEIVLTHGSGKSWKSHAGNYRRTTRVRIDSNNWRQLYDYAPSDTASLGGTKFSNERHCWDDQWVVNGCQSNGYWYDVRPTTNYLTRFWFSDNAGYGFTTEVSGEINICDFITVRNGGDTAHSRDGYRLSGVCSSDVFNGTAVDNYGADMAIYEDSRQYAGASAGQRSLTTAGGPTIPDQGNSYKIRFQNNVMCRGPRGLANKNAFFSKNGSIKPLMGPSGPTSSTGWSQTETIHTKEMFADDPRAGTLAWSSSGPNVFIKCKNEAGKIIRWATPTATWTVNTSTEDISGVSGCTATTLFNLTDIHAISANLELNSAYFDDPGAPLTKYFPNIGDAVPVYTWKALTNIPGTSTAIPTHTLPTWTIAKFGGGNDTVNLASDILGYPSSSSAVKAGCHNAPVPRPAGSVAPTSLAISTTSIDPFTAGVADTFQMVATGGSGSYTWSKTGTFPTGITMSSAGLITATTGTSASSASLTFTVNDGTSSLTSPSMTVTVTASGGMSITETSLPAAMVGAAYSQTLHQTGGTAPITWARTSGSAGPFPAGIALAPVAGTIAGTPTTAGTATGIIIQATDSSGTPKTATRTYSLLVYPQLAITTASLNQGTVGAAYSQTLAATGGTGSSYTYAVTSGSLPTGLTLSAGTISGTPSVAGTSTFTVTVTNNSVWTDTQDFALTVNDSDTVTIAETVLLRRIVGVNASQTLHAAGGTSPYTWTKTAGTWPAGITMTSAGVISGTATSATSTAITIKCTDSTSGAALTASRTFGFFVDATNSVPDVATLSSPTAGTVSGTVSLAGHGHDPNEGDNVTVQLVVDGVLTSPVVALSHTTGDNYAGSWNSLTVADGDHTLALKVSDSAGAFIVSTPVTVTVSNATGDTTPPTITSLSFSDGTTFTGPVTITVVATDASGVSTVVGQIDHPDGTSETRSMT